MGFRRDSLFRGLQMSLFIKDLEFSYDRNRVINKVSIESNASSLGLLGPNGSGKTTLI